MEGIDISKALQGVALIAGAVAVGAAEFALASTGIGISALPFLTEAMETLAVGGIAMEAGALASALIDNRGEDITTRQPAAARQIIYGMQRVGGISVYQSTTGSSNNQYNYAIAFAAHECWGIDALYLDGRLVIWQGANPAHPSAYYLPSPLGNIYFGGEAAGGSYEGPDGVQYSFNNLVLAAAYYGNQTAADLCGGFTANDPNWNISSSGTPYLGGCTWIYLKCEYSTTTFPQAPEIRATIYGKPLYDPRTGETVYSANSALVVADWLQDTTYGLGLTVNRAQLIAAANVCDEQIPLAAGGTESQYQCHYHFDTSTAPSDALATMLKSMGGRISMIGGEVYIWPAYWQGPSGNFDESSLTAPLKWDPTSSYKDNCNVVAGTYTAPNFPYNIAGNLYDSNGFYDGEIQNNFQFGFQPTNFPQYAQDPLHGYATNQWLNEDSGVSAAWSDTATYALGEVVGYTTSLTGDVPYYQIYKSTVANNTGNTPGTTSTEWTLAGVTLPMEVNYNMVLSIAQAQRLAKIALLRSRSWGAGTIEMGLSAFTLQEADVMNFTFPLHGWVDKQLEIVGCTFKTITPMVQPGELPKPPEHRMTFNVIETEASIYEWSDEEELTIYDIPALPQQQTLVPAPPTNMTLISSAATALVGVDGIVSPRIEVTWDTPLDGFVTEIQIQYQPVVGTGAWLDGGTVSVDVNLAFIGPVIAGQQYSVQIRSLRPYGSASPWVGPLTITAGLVLSVQTEDGVGVGSLISEAYPNGFASIVCNPFTALIGQLSLPIFPAGPVTIPYLDQQTVYYVYYIDPNAVGGNVTPHATTILTDFIGKVGYWLIDEIATCYCPTTGSVGYYFPSTAVDVGTRSTLNASVLFNGASAGSAIVSGNATATTNTFGDCIFAGFTETYGGLTGILSVTCSTTQAPDSNVSVIAIVGGAQTTLLSSETSTSEQTYTLSIPSGTYISTISVIVVTVPAPSVVGSVSCSIESIFVKYLSSTAGPIISHGNDQ